MVKKRTLRGRGQEASKAIGQVPGPVGQAFKRRGQRLEQEQADDDQRARNHREQAHNDQRDADYAADVQAARARGEAVPPRPPAFTDECRTTIKSVGIFLDKLDELNQYYLQNIDWAAGDEKETAIDVKKLLERSLSDNRIYYKFDLIYDAYEMMIYIIDPEGNEPPIPICDQKFLNKFESIKKRKYDDI
jgi:hypothetical protein